MERDDIQAELATVRRRRAEAFRTEAELARKQAALKARLAKLTCDAPGETYARAEPAHRPARSAADLPDAIHTWRQTIRSVNSLSMDVLGGRDHVRGDPAAPLVVVEYGDYQCSECAAAHALYRRVEPWVQDGRMAAVFRHFPLVDAHPLALRAAQAAEAAAAQGAFWEMHDRLMGLARDRGDQGLTPRRHMGDLEHAARRVGLDLDRFHAALDDPAILERILEDFRGGIASGVNGTPTFYVDGLRADVGGLDELFERLTASVGI